MAGSYQHILDGDGNVVDNVTFIDRIENLGDAYEMALDMHRIIVELRTRLGASNE